MVRQPQAGKNRRHVKRQNLFPGFAVKNRQHHRDQPAHDGGVAVAGKMQADIVSFPHKRRHQPHLRLAAADLPFVGAAFFGKRRQLFAEVDQVTVFVFPVVQQFKIFA